MPEKPDELDVAVQLLVEGYLLELTAGILLQEEGTDCSLELVHQCYHHFGDKQSDSELMRVIPAAA